MYAILYLSLCTLTSAGFIETNFKQIRKIYDHCDKQPDAVVKCYKVQALKVLDRALHSKALNILDGITLVATDSRQAKMLVENTPQLNETKLETLQEDEVDGLLVNTSEKFLDTHKVRVDFGKLVEESRKKKGKGHGALLWALAIKGSFLAMAYKGIAVMAGTALIVGKMALLLSAILGLKKLVSHGHEKTTLEIVKHPKYSESHTHSYEEEGHYHRSFDSGEEQQFGRKLIKRNVPYKFY